MSTLAKSLQTNFDFMSWFSSRYCPSVFILKPGQMVHINKGRLHAFRKMSTSTLQSTDCHHDLRQKLQQQQSISVREQLCFSIAWDWMFKGVTKDGIKEEFESVLECARLNCKHKLQSLAIPETALLFLAKENVARYNSSKSASESLIQCGPTLPVLGSHGQRSEPSPKTVLSGILPSLEYVVQRHKSAVQEVSSSSRNRRKAKRAKKTNDGMPDTWQNLATPCSDPYVESQDFVCKFCKRELSNIYMHCNGCETLLSQDYNICTSCHSQDEYKSNSNSEETVCSSLLHHTGKLTENSKSSNCCNGNMVCTICEFCTGCSCKCHQQFSLRYRFMNISHEEQLLNDVKKIVNEA